MGHRKADKKDLVCFLQSGFGTGHTHTDKGMHLGLVNLMSGLALIAHERRQNGLEKEEKKKTPLHTDTLSDQATFLCTSKRQKHVSTAIPNTLHPASATQQTQLLGRHTVLEEKTNRLCVCVCVCLCVSAKERFCPVVLQQQQ